MKIKKMECHIQVESSPDGFDLPRVRTGDGLTNDNIGIPSRFSSLGKGRVLAVVFADSGRNWQAGV